MYALIIEDEYFIAELIEDRLRELGYTSFAFAATEEEAFVEATLRRPYLITSDVQLAPGCGIDAVQRICELKSVPTVFITGSALLVHDRCPLAVLIQKPFSMADLQHGVRQARLAA